MEDVDSVLKRRNSIPSSVLIPSNLESVPMIKPRKSSSANGHHQNHRQLPPSSSSSSPSSSSTVSGTAEFDMVSFKSSPTTYTSIKDLILPSSPNLLSPTAVSGASSSAASNSAFSGGGGSTLEISIRNRLVKQAAWAYLQPMASSPSASGRRLCSYFTCDFIKPSLTSMKRSIVDWAARACNWLSDALWLLLCR